MPASRICKVRNRLHLPETRSFRTCCVKLLVQSGPCSDARAWRIQ